MSKFEPSGQHPDLAGGATNELATVPNPELTVGEDNLPYWSEPKSHRWGNHNLYRIARYGTSYRAARVMTLRERTDPRIGEMGAVRHLTSLPWFTAMAVIRGSDVLFERYAPDFGPDRPHPLKSTSKSAANLVIGRMVEEGKIDLGRRVADYLPWIGSGYAAATVQQVLNMDVANDYTEEYLDRHSGIYYYGEALGWCLPPEGRPEYTHRTFVPTITSNDTTNRTGHHQYKSPNTDVLGMIAEVASGRPLRAYYADLADGAGIEGCLWMSTGRDGFPNVCGGMCLTARDLARYGSIFARRGRGVDGRPVGSASFIDASLRGGIPMAGRPGLRYSNQLFTDGRFVAHSGSGGQLMLADLTSGVVGAFFSTVEFEDVYKIDQDKTSYWQAVVDMLRSIGLLEFKV
ncbi:serine hydrolase [Bradyrhizobium sp. SRL28]|uniref:serine hydrolase domain-containing protein n=1 Tax=Bradyrhizobium sp. SRL28 TaxID=2836178 RepID=UPI001BDDFA83|nr:serine hydrolase [Bradyrhizobium sp. SRL28]MBT1516869.1 serine hydrolase [Bradyrhizobium sp. SRL28]